MKKNIDFCLIIFSFIFGSSIYSSAKVNNADNQDFGTISNTAVNATMAGAIDEGMDIPGDDYSPLAGQVAMTNKQNAFIQNQNFNANVSIGPYWNVGAGTTSPLQPLNVNGNGSFNGGLSTASYIDPKNDWYASGSLVTTTSSGTNNSGQNILNVASATGWVVNMGINVANAGTGGNTPLISWVTNINGTAFTLNDNLITTITAGQTVMHDDTRALKFAVNEACYDNKNIHISQTGSTNCYPISSVINIPCATTIFGDGARGDNVSQKGEVATNNGTCIQNEGKTNDVFDDPTGNTVIRDIAIQQDTTVTPTAGFAINIGIGTVREFSQKILMNNIFGTFEGISIGPKVTGYILYGNHVRTVQEPFFMNNADPSGDSFISDNYFGNTVAGIANLGSYFTCASINSVANNKFIDGNPPVKIDGAQCASIGLRFLNNSIENSGGANGLLQILGSTNGVTGLTFTGGEIGSDSGNGGVHIVSGSVDVSFNHVTYSDITGQVFKNSGSGQVENFDPILSNGSSPTGNFLIGNVGIGSINPNVTLDLGTAVTYNGITTGVAQKVNTGSIYFKAPFNNGTGLLVPEIIEDSGGNARNVLGIDALNPPNSYLNAPANTFFSIINGGDITNKVITFGAGGNIGIGTVAPNSPLDVVGNVGIGTGKNSAYITGTPGVGQLVVEKNVGIGTFAPGARLEIEGGNVGIGTWSAGDALQVNGAIKFNGNLAGGVTGNIGIGTATTGAGNTCDSACNTGNQRCVMGFKIIAAALADIEPCSVSIVGDCVCLPAT